MPDLSNLSTEKLQNYLLNALRHFDAQPEKAAALIPDILSHMAARRELAPTGQHLLTTLGYNVQWRDWHAKERHRLLSWLVSADLPKQIEHEMGPRSSRPRCSFITNTITRWIKMYGQRPHMEQAMARWQADLKFVQRLQDEFTHHESNP